jgi:iron complex outermembrane receptor protein
VRIPFENRLDPTRDTTSAYSRLSPKGGVSVELGRGWTVFGSVGTAYRAPAVIELACADEAEPCPLPFALGDDPPVKPVRAVTYEAGGRLVAGQAILTASAYRTDVRDEVVLLASDLSPSGSTIEGYFDNLDKTRRVGLELSGQLFLGGGHTLYANYAFTRATYQSDAEIFSVREDFGGENDVKPGDRFPLVPDHQAKLGGSFDLTSGFSLGIDGRYIGSQYLRGDEANEEEKLDDYFVMDARVGWEGAGWELNLVATNVLQSEYASFGTFNVNQGAGGTLERFLTPGYKRVVRLIVRRSFGAD